MHAAVHIVDSWEDHATIEPLSCKETRLRRVVGFSHLQSYIDPKAASAYMEANWRLDVYVEGKELSARLLLLTLFYLLSREGCFYELIRYLSVNLI